MRFALIGVGLAILVGDIWMSLTKSGFLVPQMVIALFAIALIASGWMLPRTGPAQDPPVD